MPFDGRNATLIPDTLEAALFETGIEPVRSHALCAHKAEELRYHPASWFYQHRRAVEVIGLVLLAFGSVAALTLVSLDHPVLSLIVALGMLGVVVAPSVVPVRGPALWRERVIYQLTAVHPVIRESAVRLQERLPGIRFKLGELVQDRVVLDPYLIAEYRDQSAILGVWDGHRLIAPRPND